MLSAVKPQIINTWYIGRRHIDGCTARCSFHARDSGIDTTKRSARSTKANLDFIDTAGTACINDRIIHADAKSTTRGHIRNVTTATDPDIRDGHSSKAGICWYTVLRGCSTCVYHYARHQTELR